MRRCSRWLYSSAGALRALLIVALAGAACGPSGTLEPDPGTVPQQVGVTLDSSVRYQTMQGFGGSVAFEISFLSNHPNRDELYQVLFPDLGIQILRVANWYRNSQAPGNPEDLAISTPRRRWWPARARRWATTR